MSDRSDEKDRLKVANWWRQGPGGSCWHDGKYHLASANIEAAREVLERAGFDEEIHFKGGGYYKPAEKVDARYYRIEDKEVELAEEGLWVGDTMISRELIEDLRFTSEGLIVLKTSQPIQQLEGIRCDGRFSSGSTVKLPAGSTKSGPARDILPELVQDSLPENIQKAFGLEENVTKEYWYKLSPKDVFLRFKSTDRDFLWTYHFDSEGNYYLQTNKPRSGEDEIDPPRIENGAHLASPYGQRMREEAQKAEPFSTVEEALPKVLWAVYEESPTFKKRLREAGIEDPGKIEDMCIIDLRKDEWRRHYNSLESQKHCYAYAGFHISDCGRYILTNQGGRNVFADDPPDNLVWLTKEQTREVLSEFPTEWSEKGLANETFKALISKKFGRSPTKTQTKKENTMKDQVVSTVKHSAALVAADEAMNAMLDTVRDKLEASEDPTANLVALYFDNPMIREVGKFVLAMGLLKGAETGALPKSDIVHAIGSLQLESSSQMALREILVPLRKELVPMLTKFEEEVDFEALGLETEEPVSFASGVAENGAKAEAK